jgi:hypothetical protein
LPNTLLLSKKHAKKGLVEQELSEFFATLPQEQQAAVQPLYQRLVEAMTPAAHMPCVRVDSENAVSKQLVGQSPGIASRFVRKARSLCGPCSMLTLCASPVF